MTLMLIKSFTFQRFNFFFQFILCLPLSHSAFSLPSILPSLDQLTLDRLAKIPPPNPLSVLLHFHGVVFLITLCVPLLSPPFVPFLHWRGQMLAGMIAEPAFLSEYTIFALDHSNRPKTAQVASVVSLSSLPASFSSCSSFSSSSCPVPSSRLLRVWGTVRGLWLE